MAEINERANEYISKIEGMRCEELDGFISHVFHTMPTKEQLEARKNWGIHDAWQAFIDGATDQKAIDHSEEHLNWIINQYRRWVHHNWHTPIGSHCTFKEWVDKAMEG